jgi:hypothetical protein
VPLLLLLVPLLLPPLPLLPPLLLLVPPLPLLPPVPPLPLLAVIPLSAAEPSGPPPLVAEPVLSFAEHAVAKAIATQPARMVSRWLIFALFLSSKGAQAPSRRGHDPIVATVRPLSRTSRSKERMPLRWPAPWPCRP